MVSPELLYLITRIAFDDNDITTAYISIDADNSSESVIHPIFMIIRRNTTFGV